MSSRHEYAPRALILETSGATRFSLFGITGTKSRPVTSLK